jgi:hypothetical protein
MYGQAVRGRAGHEARLARLTYLLRDQKLNRLLTDTVQ